ncbi:hypothetical protein pb186bvf_006743 [Paramecium bursaria]
MDKYHGALTILKLVVLQNNQKKLKEALEALKQRPRHIKQKSSTPKFDKMILTFYWSLAVNKIAKVFKQRQKKIFKALIIETNNAFKFKSESNSMVLKNGNHKRYLSDQQQRLGEQSEQPKHRRMFTNPKQTLSARIPQIVEKQKSRQSERELEIEADIMGKDSMIQHLNIDKSFLDLFSKQNSPKSFGKLSPRSLEKQQQIKERIYELQPIIPINSDLNTFLQLVKRKQLNIQNDNVKCQESFNLNFIYITMVLSFLLISIIFI